MGADTICASLEDNDCLTVRPFGNCASKYPLRSFNPSAFTRAAFYILTVHPQTLDEYRQELSESSRMKLIQEACNNEYSKVLEIDAGSAGNDIRGTPRWV